jgi:uncharacterized protein YbaA (DUF1428 family)
MLLQLPTVFEDATTKKGSYAIRRWICSACAKEEAMGLCPYGQKAGKIWREHGVLEVRESAGDDLTGMCDEKTMPFNVKRMVYGGFKVLVDA